MSGCGDGGSRIHWVVGPLSVSNVVEWAFSHDARRNASPLSISARSVGGRD